MKYLNIREYNYSNLQETIEMVLYSLVCFFAPFAIGHPQLLVGVLVNAALIMAALNLRSYKLLPVILLPSIGVLTKGMIFGPFTIFLIYMIPFIWIGNAILVYSFKKFNLEKKMNKWLTLAIGVVLKTGFLFSIAFVLVKLSVLPAIFMTTMGLFQLYTAVLGGVLAFSLQAVKRRAGY